jgi:hypothetical protein
MSSLSVVCSKGRFEQSDSSRTEKVIEQNFRRSRAGSEEERSFLSANEEEKRKEKRK